MVIFDSESKFIILRPFIAWSVKSTTTLFRLSPQKYVDMIMLKRKTIPFGIGAMLEENRKKDISCVIDDTWTNNAVVLRSNLN